jgi:hypothetical protein
VRKVADGGAGGMEVKVVACAGREEREEERGRERGGG